MAPAHILADAHKSIAIRKAMDLPARRLHPQLFTNIGSELFTGTTAEHQDLLIAHNDCLAT